MAHRSMCGMLVGFQEGRCDWIKHPHLHLSCLCSVVLPAEHFPLKLQAEQLSGRKTNFIEPRALVLFLLHSLSSP